MELCDWCKDNVKYTELARNASHQLGIKHKEVRRLVSLAANAQRNAGHLPKECEG